MSDRADASSIGATLNHFADGFAGPGIMVSSVEGLLCEWDEGDKATKE